jgi:hypothetical protein
MFGEQRGQLHSWLNNFLKVPVTFIYLSVSLSGPSIPFSAFLSYILHFVFFHIRTKTKIPTHTKQQFRFYKFLGRRTWENKIE